jgi:hypothetical protein
VGTPPALDAESDSSGPGVFFLRVLRSYRFGDLRGHQEVDLIVFLPVLVPVFLRVMLLSLGNHKLAFLPIEARQGAVALHEGLEELAWPDPPRQIVELPPLPDGVGGELRVPELVHLPGGDARVGGVLRCTGSGRRQEGGHGHRREGHPSDPGKGDPSFLRHFPSS